MMTIATIAVSWLRQCGARSHSASWSVPVETRAPARAVRKQLPAPFQTRQWLHSECCCKQRQSKREFNSLRPGRSDQSTPTPVMSCQVTFSSWQTRSFAQQPTLNFPVQPPPAPALWPNIPRGTTCATNPGEFQPAALRHQAPSHSPFARISILSWRPPPARGG